MAFYDFGSVCYVLTYVLINIKTVRSDDESYAISVLNRVFFLDICTDNALIT